MQPPRDKYSDSKYMRGDGDDCQDQNLHEENIATNRAELMIELGDLESISVI